MPGHVSRKGLLMRLTVFGSCVAVLLSTSSAVHAQSADGSMRELLTDSRLRWPDTFSQGPDGAIYVTASHIQDSPWFHVAWTDKNFTLFKFMPGDGNTVGSHLEPNHINGGY